MSDHPRDAEPNVQDVAPGLVDAEEYTIREGIEGYLIGLGLATLLTVVSFFVAKSNLFWQPSIPIALVVLAIAQIAVHLIFFIHITTAPDNTNNILALAFGVLIVTLVVAGSLWIMYNLNHNMMPMDQMMHMQRGL
jgi:cytochrome o ubiquinol oxidase operon protein cyoD